MPGRSLHRRGAALLLVIAVIVALVVIAAPFALSMRLHERSSRAYAAQAKARHAARAGRNLALRKLLQSHGSSERSRNQEPNGDDYDGLEEVSAQLEDLTGLSTLTMNDPRGDMVRVETFDEQGRLDINTASPFALASLLGTTTLTEDAAYAEDKALQVVDTSEFYSDGDPRTIDGIIRVRGEYIAYRHTTPTSFQGLIRGLYLSRPIPEEDGAESVKDETKAKLYFESGMLVADARAWKIASQQLWSIVSASREGEYADFKTISEIKSIADWDFGRLRLSLNLLQYGVNIEQLRRWGVIDRLAKVGIDPALYERAVEDETDEEKTAREAREEAIEKAGLPIDQVKALGGRAARNIARTLERAAGNPKRRDAIVKRMGERVALASAQLQRRKKWLKDELPLALDNMVLLSSYARSIGTIGRIEFEELRPAITVHGAALDGRWTDPVVVLNAIDYDPEETITRLQVQDTRDVVNGAICRITPVGGGAPIYRQVLRKNRQAIIVLPKLSESYLSRTLQVSVRLPAPLNINTASRKALRALFTGLSLRGRNKQADIVTPQEADRLVERIIGLEQPLKNYIELAQLLFEAASDDDISKNDALAIVRNAINPADLTLARGTVPVTFRSNDIYTIEAAGIVNGPAGRELGRYASREIVQVAPPKELLLSIDSQADFEDRRALLGQSFFLPQRRKNLLTSFPNNLTRGGIPDRSHDDRVGDLRLSTWETADAPKGRGITQHYRDQLEGAQAPQQLPAPMGRVFNPHPSVAAVQVQVLQPGALQVWLRLDSLPGPRTVLFDLGSESLQNRLVCFYDAATQELVFRAYDEALDAIESIALGLAERRAVEVRGPVELKPGNWYHLTLAWRGGSYADLLALVDNRLVTKQETYATRLTSDISEGTVNIPVEDTAMFPAQGFLLVGGRIDDNGRRIGGEIIEYISKTPTAFRARSIAEGLTQIHAKLGSGASSIGLPSTRGMLVPQKPVLVKAGKNAPPPPVPLMVDDGHRDFGETIANRPVQITRGLPHTRGCPVTVYGYSSRLAWEQRMITRDVGGQQVQQTINAVSRLPVGGATLLYDLPEHTPLTLLYRAPETAGQNAPPPPPPLPVPPGFQWQNEPAMLAAEMNVMPCVWLSGFPDGALTAGANAGGFPPRGILQVNQEYIGYTGINPANKSFTGLVRGMFGTTPQDHRQFSPVLLVSLAFSKSMAEYADPIGTDRMILSLYQGPGKFEWLRARLINDPSFPNILLLSHRGGRRPIPTKHTRAAIIGPNFNQDARWTFMQILVGLLNAGQGRLPPNIADRPIAGAGGAKPTKEWLKAIEPFPDERGFQRTGIGADLGGDRGPGIQSPAMTKVLPVVRISRTNTGIFPGEVVTILDDASPPAREERRVSWVGADQAGRVMFALDDYVSRDFTPTQGGRLAKWPTGLLPAPGPIAIGAPIPKAGAAVPGATSQPVTEAAMTGRIDELKFVILNNAPKGILGAPMTASDTLLAQTQGAAFVPKRSRGRPPTPFLLKAGSEILALSQPENGSVVRGLLASDALDLGAEEAVWRLDVPAINLAETGYQGAYAERFQVRQGQSLNAFPARDGYVAIDRGMGMGPFDVIAYKQRRGANLFRPLDRFGRGVADHNFGSGQGQGGGLVQGDVLVQMPVRFHDRYEEGRSSLDATLFSFSRTLPGARFESIDWEVQHPNPYTQIVVRVRVDGGPDWESPRQNATGDQGLFVFKDPPDRTTARGQTKRVNFIRKRGDQIDVQVYLTFKPQAFFRDGWKQTPVLKSLKIKYYQPTQIRAHEEKRE